MKPNKKITQSITSIPSMHPNLYQLITHTPISVDELAVMLSMSIEQTLTKLIELEIQGVIKNVEGGYVRLL